MNRINKVILQAMNFKIPAADSFDNLKNIELILNLVAFDRTLAQYHAYIYPNIFIIILRTMEHI